jgi:hypothetical protein
MIQLVPTEVSPADSVYTSALPARTSTDSQLLVSERGSNSLSLFNPCTATKDVPRNGEGSPRDSPAVDAGRRLHKGTKQSETRDSNLPTQRSPGKARFSQGYLSCRTTLNWPHAHHSEGYLAGLQLRVEASCIPVADQNSSKIAVVLEEYWTRDDLTQDLDGREFKTNM